MSSEQRIWESSERENGRAGRNGTNNEYGYECMLINSPRLRLRADKFGEQIADNFENHLSYHESRDVGPMDFLLQQNNQKRLDIPKTTPSHYLLQQLNNSPHIPPRPVLDIIGKTVIIKSTVNCNVVVRDHHTNIQQTVLLEEVSNTKLMLGLMAAWAALLVATSTTPVLAHEVHGTTEQSVTFSPTLGKEFFGFVEPGTTEHDPTEHDPTEHDPTEHDHSSEHDSTEHGTTASTNQEKPAPATSPLEQNFLLTVKLSEMVSGSPSPSQNAPVPLLLKLPTSSPRTPESSHLLGDENVPQEPPSPPSTLPSPHTPPKISPPPNKHVTISSLRFRYPFSDELPPGLELGYCLNLRRLNWLQNGSGGEPLFKDSFVEKHRRVELSGSETLRNVTASDSYLKTTQSFGGSLEVPLWKAAEGGPNVSAAFQGSRMSANTEKEFRSAFYAYHNAFSEKFDKFDSFALDDLMFRRAGTGGQLTTCTHYISEITWGTSVVGETKVTTTSRMTENELHAQVNAELVDGQPMLDGSGDFSDSLKEKIDNTAVRLHKRGQCGKSLVKHTHGASGAKDLMGEIQQVVVSCEETARAAREVITQKRNSVVGRDAVLEAAETAKANLFPLAFQLQPLTRHFDEDGNYWIPELTELERKILKDTNELVANLDEINQFLVDDFTTAPQTEASKLEESQCQQHISGLREKFARSIVNRLDDAVSEAVVEDIAADVEDKRTRYTMYSNLVDVDSEACKNSAKAWSGPSARIGLWKGRQVPLAGLDSFLDWVRREIGDGKSSGAKYWAQRNWWNGWWFNNATEDRQQLWHKTLQEMEATTLTLQKDITRKTVEGLRTEFMAQAAKWNPEVYWNRPDEKYPGKKLADRAPWVREEADRRLNTAAEKFHAIVRELDKELHAQKNARW